MNPLLNTVIVMTFLGRSIVSHITLYIILKNIPYQYWDPGDHIIFVTLKSGTLFDKLSTSYFQIFTGNETHN